ncbi:nuclear autoantigen Sp-100 [Hydra vulgaris]|uniref:nuclear autoantigen Sp-100 n=1 Tax=Hydra vulgaris TaxID=6087 RepID=UPI0001926B13|nr:nuclear autoantigen Sp-100 [Hydra vulgaris]
MTAKINFVASKTRNQVDNVDCIEEQNYKFWAQPENFDTAGEVEISSSLTENHDLLSFETSEKFFESSTIKIEDICDSKVLERNIDQSLQDQQHIDKKRENDKLQVKFMNDEYQKAIGYLLCANKSKSGKQKKKQTMTAYLFFCKRYRPKIVARNPKLTFTQMSKLLSHMWRNASEHEKNTFRLKLKHHRTKVNAIVEKNLIEKMKIVKQEKQNAKKKMACEAT